MKEKKRNALSRMLENIVRNDRKIFLFCVLYTVAALFVPLFSVALPKILIGYLTMSESTPTIKGVVIISTVLFVVGAVFYFLREWLKDYAYPHITALRIDYVRDQAVKLTGIEYKYIESANFFDEHQMSFQATSSNSNGIEGIYHKVFELPQLVLTVLVLSVLIGFRSPLILIALLIHIAATTFAAVSVQKYEYKKKEELSHSRRRVSYYAQTAKDFTYGKDVRVYNLKARISENFGKEIKCYINSYSMIKNREFFIGFITLFTLLLSDIATYGILTYLTFNGMSIADYSMYVVAASTLSLRMTELSDNITFILREYMYVRDFYDFLDSDLGERGGDEKAVSADIPLEIEFDNVTFRYPGTDNCIYRDFSLKIPAGQKLAIVGINGAGKTTLIKLLTGLFTPDSGRILINGKEVGSYNKTELYSMFAPVFQEVNITAFTIAQNIACRLDGIDYEKVDKVLSQVGLYDKVHELPQGVNTMMLKVIDEDGAVFSGGQNQKLAIARALYKGGNCIIMDEPTAALDALAEAEIYSEFDLLTQGKTAIYISHRLASTKFCDKIALLDRDGLREYGTHDELLRLGGSYYEMFMTQGKYYREGSETDEKAC